MSQGPKAMTAFAQAALAASDLINAKFAKTKFGGSVPRIVKVEMPQVESTGGGRQARESVVLKPESGDASKAITAGFLDVGIRGAELRTWSALALQYEQRHKTKLDLPEGEYDTFLREIRAFLEEEGFVVKMIDGQTLAQKQTETAKKTANIAVEEKGGGANVPVLIGVGVALIAVVVAAIMFLK